MYISICNDNWGIKSLSLRFDSIIKDISNIDTSRYYGQVTAVQGLFIEVGGVRTQLSIGDRCNVLRSGNKKIPCEVVSFKGERLILMPYGSLEGIALGSKVEVENAAPIIYPHIS